MCGPVTDWLPGWRAFLEFRVLVYSTGDDELCLKDLLHMRAEFSAHLIRGSATEGKRQLCFLLRPPSSQMVI